MSLLTKLIQERKASLGKNNEGEKKKPKGLPSNLAESMPDTVSLSSLILSCGIRRLDCSTTLQLRGLHRSVENAIIYKSEMGEMSTALALLFYHGANLNLVKEIINSGKAVEANNNVEEAKISNSKRAIKIINRKSITGLDGERFLLKIEEKNNTLTFPKKEYQSFYNFIMNEHMGKLSSKAENKESESQRLCEAVNAEAQTTYLQVVLSSKASLYFNSTEKSFIRYF